MKQRILIITPRPPYPLFSGGEHAQFHFIEAMKTQMDVSVCFEINSSDYNSNLDDFQKLKRIWKEVTFFPFLNIDNTNKLIRIYREVKHTVSNIKGKIYEVISAKKTDTDHALEYQSLVNQPYILPKGGFVNFVADVLLRNHFDIIQVEFIFLAPLVYLFPKESIKVLVHHELRYVRIKREVDLFKNASAYDLLRLQAIKQQEISLLKEFDKIITLTGNDKEVLSAYLKAEDIFVSPATIKVNPAETVPFNPFCNKLVFIGSSLHLPNKEGIQWFINKVLPIIETSIPGIELKIIGSWDKAFIKQFSRTNVKFTGYIENLTEDLKFSLFIVPIRIGSGMRLKIIEAVIHHIPFITTSVGVEGLDFENENECLIADSPESFANGIVRLATDSSLQQHLVRNASLKLAEKYSFESCIKKRLDFYKSLA